MWRKFKLQYRGADKSLAQPGRKQATATKLYLLQATQKNFRNLSVQPGLRGSNYLRVGRKMATFQLFFQSGRAKDLSAPLYFPNKRIKTCIFLNSARYNYRGAMKEYRGVEACRHCFLSSALVDDRSASRPGPLDYRYLLTWRLSEPQRLPRRFGENKNLSPCWLHTRISRPIVITIPTELSRPLCGDSGI